MTTDIFHNAHRYGDMTGWRQEAVELHHQGPVHRIEADGFPPFWAVIGHDEVMAVERQPALFTNEPVPVLTTDAVLQMRDEGGPQIRTLIHMDKPDHTDYRRLTNDWFKPANINSMQARLDELSRVAVAKLEAAASNGTGTIDFNTEIAVPYPLQVILSILGLPEGDYERMLQLTQELFGAEDPDLQREGGSPEETAAVLMDFYQYFTGLTADRQANPTDDLATLIANGEIRGEPMPDLEKMGYYVIVATAGHDTTSASMAEGMAQLARNPDQLQLLQEQPELIGNAVEEMIRMASSVRHFMRTAQEDTEVGGQTIKKGDWLMLNYAAANMDPGYFEDPTRFDVTRSNASKHIAFGFGIHFCLGAQLARQELRSLFSHLVPRLASAELEGKATTGKATFVSGYKALPLNYTLN
ncbi:cytochrome P450 [Ilumatobacter nonamiensis]|uniref:cytochrome P450 n=1 Tax=Ilumatobacter nonamiensis TaxID=467093 RepID=UPI000348E45F|nr:cytochrome P450 [Ilumatobacter nonamiensis]